MNQPVAVDLRPGCDCPGPSGCSAVDSLRHHPETSMKTGETPPAGPHAGIEGRSGTGLGASSVDRHRSCYLSDASFVRTAMTHEPFSESSRTGTREFETRMLRV